jgi:hypothetical protein
VSLIALFIIFFILTKRMFTVSSHYQRRSGDTGENEICRGNDNVMVHEMDGALIYYHCQRCGKEWHKGDEGYEKAKFESHLEERE